MFKYEIRTYGQIRTEHDVEVDGNKYLGIIKNALANDWDTMDKELGLGEYIWDDDHKKMGTQKVIIPTPKVEVQGSNLNLIWTVETDAKLTKEGQEILLDYVTGQCSDGWGEGFEQNSIAEVDDEDNCDTCDGAGSEDCSACDGTGKSEEEDEEGNEEDCDTCGGNGSEDCSICDGSGMMDIKAQVYAHPWDSKLSDKNTIKEI